MSNKKSDLSKHAAQERIPQRGVPMRMVALVRDYGDEFISNRESSKAVCLYFSRRSLDQMRRDRVDHKLIQDAERRMHLRFVVSGEGTLITVKHAWHGHRRIQDRARAWVH